VGAIRARYPDAVFTMLEMDMILFNVRVDGEVRYGAWQRVNVAGKPWECRVLDKRTGEVPALLDEQVRDRWLTGCNSLHSVD
jgi:hypothetical protein